jgi:hypothetical protein
MSSNLKISKAILYLVDTIFISSCKIMKKKSFSPFVIIVLILLSSCTKNRPTETGNSYYMKFKADGRQVEFPISGIEISDTVITGAVYAASVAGASLDGSKSLGLALYSKSSIKAGTQFTCKYIPGTSFLEGAIIYIPSLTSETLSTVASPGEGTITLLELTPTYARGTFSGNVYDNAGSASSLVKITDGEFYTKRQ